MAVQAQYPSNAFRVGNNMLEEHQLLQQQQQQQQQLRENLSGNQFGPYNNYAGQLILNGTVFSEPESELTCNVSGSRKRNRNDQMSLTQHQLQQQLRFAKLPKVQPDDKTATATLSTGLQLSNEDNRVYESGGTSTSGRSAVLSLPSLLSPLPQDLASYLYNQDIEIDALIRFQNEKLRSLLEETQKKHCRLLLSILEQQVLKMLTEKESELEKASRRNMELEEKVRQMNVENQMWFNVAKNNEAIVSSLKSNLEQILLQNTAHTREGFGDSDGIALVDDDQSCNEGAVEDKTRLAAEKTIRENWELKNRKSCRVCREKDVSILVLPCRHLCLCKDCEGKLDYCPICKCMKNASLQILMS